MAQDIKIAGAQYSGVPYIEIPTVGGSTAKFIDTSDASAAAADVAAGKTFYVNGVKITGTASGGSSGSAPLCVASVTSNNANVVENAVNISAVVSVSQPSGVEYYYNHEQIGEIPTEAVEEYPYIVILRYLDGTFRMYAAETKIYISTAEDSTVTLVLPMSARCRYDYNTAARAWVLQNIWNGTSGTIELHGGSNWAVWWSNYDMPDGSADATEIYLPASEPKTEAPAEPTYYFYNGDRIPALPADILADHPYAFIQKMPTKYYLVLSTEKYYHSNGSHYPLGTVYNYNLFFEELEAGGTWVFDNNTAWIHGSSNLFWANYDMPDGSADAAEVFIYGTLPVPV